MEMWFTFVAYIRNATSPLLLILKVLQLLRPKINIPVGRTGSPRKAKSEQNSHTCKSHGIHTCIRLTCIQVYLDFGNGIYFFTGNMFSSLRNG
jgi:hypothetical protein